MTSQQQIDQIDKQIDANRRALMARLHVSPDCSAHVWQNAWDRCPDLYAREQSLYRQRGELQQLRDREIERAWQAEQRATRAKARKASRASLKQTVTRTVLSFPGDPDLELTP